MKPEALKEEISIELENIDTVVEEIVALRITPSNRAEDAGPANLP